MKKNIILIGYMGVGKSEVGMALASVLGMKYVDTDDIIEKEQHSTISEIFRDRGEAHFRDLESKVLDGFSGVGGHVISTGGGIVLKAENVRKLKALGPVVLLTSRPEIIEKRLSRAENRPLLDVSDRGGRIRQMLKERDPAYRTAADFSIDTSDLLPGDAAAKIIERCEGEER